MVCICSIDSFASRLADRLAADLNNLLSEFYSKHASFTNAVEWMDKSEYQNATADDATEEWMCQ
jgi:hypothetical protein